MRLKVILREYPVHKDVVGCVTWSSTDEVYSCSDEHVILKWNVRKNEPIKIVDLPNEILPTDMHWFPKRNMENKPNSELLLITSADGAFILINKNGRIEKHTTAHKGAVLTGRWSYDGGGFFTGGEDGELKIWSKYGVFRATIYQSAYPVYCATWSPDSANILYTIGRNVGLKSIDPQSKEKVWKAHDGLVLKVAWHAVTNLIITGGEDCKYKVWDQYGLPLFVSLVHEHPISSLTWSPNGDLFVVGSFNTLRLCDKAGWSYSLEKPNIGSVFDIAWSSDGTQIAGACGNGQVIFANLIERHLEWRNYEATITDANSITLNNVQNLDKELLEFSDRIIKISLGFDQLVATTSSQCFIYSSKNWNTPVSFDLKEGSVTMIKLAEKNFLLVEKTMLNVYNYEGRVLFTPKWPAMVAEALTDAFVSVSSDIFVAVDQEDEKVIHIFDIGSARSSNKLPNLVHEIEVVAVALNAKGSLAERQLALLDKAEDLYIVGLVGYSSRKISKLAYMITSFMWNTSVNMLAAVQNNTLFVWYYPNVAFVEMHIVDDATHERDISEIGRNPELVSFIGTVFTLRRLDGSLISTYFPPFPMMLLSYSKKGLWKDCLKLCRIVKDKAMWACLAALAVSTRNADVAEFAYAGCDQLAKVWLIQLSRFAAPSVLACEMEMIGGELEAGEAALIQKGLIFRAIMTNIQLFKFSRALDLALKHQTHIDTVIYYRKTYLKKYDFSETLEKFQQLENEVEIDEKKVREKIKLEYENERKRGIEERKKYPEQEERIKKSLSLDIFKPAELARMFEERNPSYIRMLEESEGIEHNDITPSPEMMRHIAMKAAELFSDLEMPKFKPALPEGFGKSDSEHDEDEEGEDADVESEP